MPHPSRMPRCTVGGDGHAVPLDGTRLLLGPAGSVDIDDDATDGPSTGEGIAQDDRFAPGDGVAHGDGVAPGDGVAHGAGVAPGERSLLAWSRFASQLADPGPVPSLLPGRQGKRLSTRDHLPLIGPVPDARALVMLAAAHRDDRLPLPILPGLWTATAFGGRGLLWSVLAAEVIAARLDGEPSALERPLAAALSPDRFLRQALRRVDTSG
jgi:glycine/D-amino acid oxidase-like deaminating enzyme